MLLFESLHLKEVLVVVISHLFLSVKIKKHDMIKTVITHLFVGSILTSLAPYIGSFMSSVVFGR